MIQFELRHKSLAVFEKASPKYQKSFYDYNLSDLEQDIDEVAKIDVELETLTQEQADYIGVDPQGPFKPEYYRY